MISRVSNGSLARAFRIQARVLWALILREIMTGAGFLQLPHEWCHFDAFPGERVLREFALID